MTHLEFLSEYQKSITPYMSVEDYVKQSNYVDIMAYIDWLETKLNDELLKNSTNLKRTKWIMQKT